MKVEKYPEPEPSHEQELILNTNDKRLGRESAVKQTKKAGGEGVLGASVRVQQI